MSTYKLVYFNFRGRAEISRLLFHLGGQAFEDKRIELGDWASFKSQTPFGKLPILEITSAGSGEKVVLSQSISIARYLANKFNLAGKTDIEKAKCDMIVDQLIDVQNSIAKIYMENKDEGELQKALAVAANGMILESLKQVEDILAANRAKKGFLVGDDLTYADLSLMYFYDMLRDHKKPILEKLRLLDEHDRKIRSIAKIAEHLKKNEHVRVSIKW